ncbi:MAG: hypothetical protein ACPGUD_10510 [Parashewanella sp.]
MIKSLNFQLNQAFLVVSSTLKKCHQTIVTKIYVLSRPQKIYLIALFALLIFDDTPMFAVALASIAIIMECLPIITFIWNTLIGKAIILLIYAVIANFALANAASLVNQVVGVATIPFSYSHNFATLLYIPSWLTTTTLFGLLMLQVVLILYTIVLFALRAVGMTKFMSLSKYPYVLITMLVRLLFIGLISSALIGKEATIASDDSQPQPIDKKTTIEKRLNSEAVNHLTFNLEHTNVVETLTELGVLMSGNTSEMSSNTDLFLLNVLNTLSDTEKTTEENFLLQQLVAHFIFYFDSDEFSRCMNKIGSHVVELNDYEFLEIIKDQSQRFGYSYEVKRCHSAAFPLAT